MKKGYIVGLIIACLLMQVLLPYPISISEAEGKREDNKDIPVLKVTPSKDSDDVAIDQPIQIYLDSAKKNFRSIENLKYS